MKLRPFGEAPRYTPHLLLAAGLLLAMRLLITPAAAANFDYCSVGSHTSLMVVDRTTKFDDTDRDILISSVEAFMRRQEAGERVVIAAMNGAYTDMKISLNECRPGCPDEGFFARLLSTCRAVIARGDDLAFQARVILVLRDLLLQSEEAPQSDLFRSLAEVTRMVQANGYAKLRQLLIYSDLLEASSVFPAGAVRRLSPAEARKRLADANLRPTVAGTDVRVIGFGRNDAPGRAALPPDVRRRLEETWQRWFQEAGAASVGIGLR